jgi:hypothetical protein
MSVSNRHHRGRIKAVGRLLTAITNDYIITIMLNLAFKWSFRLLLSLEFESTYR